jgi:SAM-dependent methyltransferase
MEKIKEQCVLCKTNAFTKQFTKNNWDVVKCDNCGLIFACFLPTPVQLEDFYNKHKQPTKERIETYLRGRTSRERRNRRKLSYLEKIQGHKGRLLDIGCGLGLLVKDASERGWQAQGIDLDKDLIEYGTKTFHVDLIHTRLEEANFPDGYFDVITMFNLLDHIGEPLTFLKEVERVLRPGGVIYLNLHDAGGWKAKKFKENWSAYCPPGHLYYYNLGTLEAMLHKTGLKFFRVPGVNFKEGIKMLAVKKSDPRKQSLFRKMLEKGVYDFVQVFNL